MKIVLMISCVYISSCGEMDLQVRVSLVRCYYQSGCSASAALRQYKTRKHECSAQAVLDIIKKFMFFLMFSCFIL
jgi:hypothetical protein